MSTESPDELLSIIGHKIKTPLSLVHNFTELLLDPDLPADKRREFTELVHSETRRLGHLIGEIVELHQLETGGIELRPVEIETATFLDNAVETFTALTEGCEVEISTGELAAARADAPRLSQTLHYVLACAVGMAVDSRAKLTASCTSGDLRIEVRSRNPAINVDLVRRCFDKWQPLPGGDGQRLQEAGLKLPLARALAAALGGGLDAALDDGGGIVLRLTVPV